MRSILRTALLIPFGLQLPGLQAQAPGPQGGTSQTTRAQQVTLSGRQASSIVTTQQTAVGGGGSSSSNTINTNVSPQGNYLSSVPDPSATGAPLGLTLRDAIRRGLQFNLGSVYAENSLSQVKAQRLAALSALLPNISASLSYTEEKLDLEAQGLTANSVPIPGFAFPKIVGPFHYYDARGTASQSVFDLTAIRNYQGSKALESASELSQQNARELVILAVSGEYLRTLSEIALVSSQETQVEYAQASYDQASAQNRAGTKSKVDAQRSLVQLQTEQQRLSSNRADLTKQKLVLIRMLGLPLRTPVSLLDRLPFREEAQVSVEESIKEAEATRKDLQASAVELRAAEKAFGAARAEHLPSVTVSGFYGIEGVTPRDGNAIFSVAGGINVPLFDGGRTRSDIQQAMAAVKQRRAEYQDQQQAVELDVRNAAIDLEVANDQVKVAESNRALALNTLKQSQDRFAEGVTDTVEVVQSEESLAAAERDYISSLYSHNVARISLARAKGGLEQVASSLLEMH